MIADEVLALLRCPATRQTLAPASAQVLTRLESARAAGTLRDASGRIIAQPIEAALIREDLAVVYPLRAGIPVLVVEEAIALA